MEDNDKCNEIVEEAIRKKRLSRRKQKKHCKKSKHWDSNIKSEKGSKDSESEVENTLAARTESRLRRVENKNQIITKRVKRTGISHTRIISVMIVLWGK